VTPSSRSSRYVDHVNFAVNKSFRGASTGVTIMQDEAKITVNGTQLTDDEARIVRLALATFADIMANQLGFIASLPASGTKLSGRRDRANGPIPERHGSRPSLD
jgi:hypothetical protein